MDVPKLQTWLKLPPGSWPPDHYTLIGLSPGSGDPSDIEDRILERMESLRRYQLAFPDLVTEGMNRLAQALDCLTTPESRRQYDQSLGIQTTAPKTVPPPPTAPVGRTIPVEVEPPPLPLALAPAPLEEVYTPEGASPLGEVILLELDDARPRDERRERNRDDEPRERKREQPTEDRDERTEEDDRDQPPKPLGWRNRIAPKRQTLIREVVKLRRGLRVLNSLREVFDEPSKPLRRFDMVQGLAALSELRLIWKSIVEYLGARHPPGEKLRELADEPFTLDLFRNLKPSRRTELADDAREASNELRDAYDRARTKLTEGRGSGVGVHLGAMLLRRPELILAPLGVLALVIAWLRRR